MCETKRVRDINETRGFSSLVGDTQETVERYR